MPENLRKALKVYKWWDQEGRADLERILDAVQGVAPETPIDDTTKSAAEDTLQTIQRRLKNFAKAGMYNLLPMEHFGMDHSLNCTSQRV